MHIETTWFVLAAVLLLIELWAINRLRKSEGKSSTKGGVDGGDRVYAVDWGRPVGIGGAEAHRAQPAGKSVTAVAVIQTARGIVDVHRRQASSLFT